MTWNSDEYLEIIDISDSDSEFGEPQPSFPTQTAFASGQVEQDRPASSPCEPSDVLVIDSTDSEDLDELEAKLKSVCFEKKTDAVTPCSPGPSTSYSAYGSPIRPTLRIESQDDILVISSSEEDAEIQSTIRRRASDSNNSTKATSEHSILQRKRKDSNISNPIPSRAYGREHIKQQTKIRSDINKLVTDKKSTLKDFIVELSHTFQGYPFVDHLESKLATHDSNVAFFDPPPRSEFLIRFRRQHIARYDKQLKEWIPITPYTELEDLYVLLLSADTLALAILEETLTKTLSALRSTYKLTARSQIFIMVDGLNAYYRCKGVREDKRDTIESALVSLQTLEKCFIVQTEGAENTAQWLFNITGDLGIKPHKRIRESFLPFCTDTKFKCGSSKADTYKKMLQQIRNITESAADGIIEEAPTLRELFEGYAREPDAYNRYHRLKEVTIANRKDGAAKSRILNQALSKKVHDIIWGEDPLTLV
ncbi:unnamed protein product [Rhizoctonia solani]|uniref:ERCC4 domain-containing protein n=1 Tax=Rhizoctonia solani TaxID=456999 RepID=A0A8H2XXN5_9AGAM|nr:unnamed protein product [Rhizoctonia solani]